MWMYYLKCMQLSHDLVQDGCIDCARQMTVKMTSYTIGTHIIISMAQLPIRTQHLDLSQMRRWANINGNAAWQSNSVKVM